MRTLALNGGGTGGYASALFLANIERETGKQCFELFNLIAGVSTGAILASALGVGIPAAQIASLYETLSPKVFQKKKWYDFSGYLYGSKYDSSILHSELERALGKRSISECKTKTMIYATKLNPGVGPQFWKSWHDEDKGIFLADAATASSSAPGFFKPFLMNGTYYIDGGLSTNCPSMACLAESVRLNGVLQNEYIININPLLDMGYTSDAVKKKSTFFSWARDIAGVAITASQQVEEYEAHQFLDFSHHVVDLKVNQQLDGWSAAIKASMSADAMVAWALHRTEIMRKLNSSE